MPSSVLVPHPPRPPRGRAVAAAALLAALALGGAARAQPPLLVATEPAAGRVVGVDLAAGGAVLAQAAGTTPAGAVLSPDGTRVFAADATSGELLRIDLAGGMQESVAVGGGPAGVALCAGGARLAVALSHDDAVAVVDAATLAVTATLAAGDQPLAIACAEGFLVVAGYGSSTLSVFDATTLAPLGTAPVGSFPAGVAIGGGRAWVTSLFDSTVTVVALPAAAPIATVDVGSAPRGVAVAAGRVFVGNVNDGTLTVLDLLGMTVIGTVPLAAPGPTELLADPGTGNLYVAHLGEPSISVVSPATLAVLDTVAAPTGLLGLAGVVPGRGVAPAEIPASGPLGLAALAAALAFLALRWRGGAAAILVAALAGGGAAHAQPVTFTDATFPPTDWEVADDTGTHSESQSPFDGNPAPSRAMVHFHLPGATVAVLHHWLAASHDPATEGAVASVSAGWDRRATGIDCPLVEVTEAFVVFQDGVAYRTAPSTFANAAWEGTTTGVLEAADFTDGASASPDFSAAGAALSFGYERVTTNDSESPAPFCHGIDNLTVTLGLAEEPPPPEPSVVGFTTSESFVLDGEDLVVGVTRTGDLAEAASVDVLVTLPFGAGPTRTVSWPAGVGGEATATFEGFGPGEQANGIAVLPMSLFNASAGTVVDEDRESALVFVGNDPLAALWVGLALLLARWEPLGALLLASLALYASLRRRRQRGARDGAGDRAEEVSGRRRRAPEVRAGGPHAPLLGGELAGERGEHDDSEPSVAAEGRDAARRQQAVEQAREPGHRRDPRREQERAERPAERGDDHGDRPAARGQLAADGERDEREPAEVPRQVRGAGVHEVRGEQPPRLAGEHGVARVGERAERARAHRRDEEAGEPEREERGVAAHGGAAWSHRWRTAAWLLAALPALAASWGCVERHSAHLAFDSARFNDRISADLQPLSPQERAADLRYGTFSDGSRDPDGDGPRRGGLVSEVFPVPAASGAAGPGNLVQAPCLFVGRRGTGGDQLRLSWEVVADVDRSADEYLGKAFLEGHDEIGMCTYSSPETRLLFEDPEADLPDLSRSARDCGPPGVGEVALTLPVAPDELTRNLPLSCRVLGNLVANLDVYAHRGPNPDSLCPSGPFEGSTTLAEVSGCMRDGDLLPACALPCGLDPREDASYRVRVAEDTPTNLPVAERWLRPDVLVVEERRTVARPMEGDTCTDDDTRRPFAWQTKVDAPDGIERPVRWAENFTPTVRVDTVRIVSRDPSGGDRVVETPHLGRLVVVIPRAGDPAPTVLECNGADGDDGFTFALAACAAASDEPAVLDALTPTYLVANLGLDPVVKQPITWRATLDRCETAREVWVEFDLRAVTMGAALRVSPLLDLGRAPDMGYRQGTVELENVGGEAVEITGLGLSPGVGHPQDFTVFAVGDPVPVPLPIDAAPLGDRGLELTLGNVEEAPLVTLREIGGAVEVRLGDPGALPGDVQALALYGEPATLRGLVLTRDDPRAAFAPAAGATRPFLVPAYAEEQLPFAMRPGERRTIAVEARPSAHGDRRAELVVRYASATQPWQTEQVRSQLRMEVVSGPLLHHAPSSLLVDRDANGGQPGHRTAMVSNTGHFDLTVHALQLSGPGASRFVVTSDLGLGPFVLRPGDYADVRVEYLPDCDGTYGTATSALDHEATLVVTSNGGTAGIGLGGASRGFCPTP